MFLNGFGICDKKIIVSAFIKAITIKKSYLEKSIEKFRKYIIK